MSIFLTESDRVIVQGMTGSEGRKHTRRMLCAGTKVVAGVNPRKAGATVAFDVAPLGHGAEALGVRPGTVEVPVHGAVAEAGRATGAAVSAIFVPPAFAREAIIEAVDAGMRLIVVITEGIPVADAVYAHAYAAERGARIIGPNCPGIISPTRSNVGITPPDITGSGPVGLVSKSGTLTYQLMHELRDLGFTTCVGIGGDPVVGTSHIDALAAFEADPDTELVVMIGEIGGDAEERAATYIRSSMTKPVVAYVAGFTAPEGRTMGHAGAIVSGSSGTARAKKAALEAAGAHVGRTPSETAALARDAHRKVAGAAARACARGRPGRAAVGWSRTPTRPPAPGGCAWWCPPTGPSPCVRVWSRCWRAGCSSWCRRSPSSPPPPPWTPRRPCPWGPPCAPAPACGAWAWAVRGGAPRVPTASSACR